MDEWNGKKLDWALQRTVKFFQKAIVLAGDDVYADDFEDGKSMEEALKRKAVGSYFNLVITETESKGKTYRNYDIEEDELQPVNAEEIEDDNLPF